MFLKENTELQGGKYRIVRFISNGGFGCTYEGVHTLMNSRVAIKEFFVSDFCERKAGSGSVSVVSKSKVELTDRLRKSFRREARAVFNMQHPNIVRVNDIFEENDTTYFVMDYIDGYSLSDIQKQRGQLPESEVLYYINQIADALKYVHSQNRLHLDLKPGNIMVNGQGQAILIDFGASKHYDKDTHEQTTTLLGMNTCGYAPPEQVSRSFTTFLPATDIYALGATMYKLLTGITPPESFNLVTNAEKLQPLPPHISASTQRAIYAAMNTNYLYRPQSIEEFMTLLYTPVDNPNDADNTYFDNNNNNNNNNNNPNNNNRKSAITAIIIILLILAILSIIAYFTMFSGSDVKEENENDSNKTELKEEPNYEALYQARCDSLYHNFSTPALQFAQVKGFVKSVEMNVGETEYGGLNLTINFDKYGNITTITNRSTPDARIVNCKISFNNSDAPSRFSYNSTLPDGYPDIGDYRFTYSNGHLTTVYLEQALYEGAYDYKYTFSGFNEDGLPTHVSLSQEGGVEDGKIDVTGSWNNTYTYDSFGNWIKLSENGSVTYSEYSEDNEYGDHTNYDVKTEITRNIIYYSPEEIDYSKFITKEGPK